MASVRPARSVLAGRGGAGMADALLLVSILLALYGLLEAGHAMGLPLHRVPHISLSPWALVGYTGLSLVRMTVAFLASVAFSLVYGYAAAKSRRAERFMVPMLDILQSVPVLGFLSFTVTFFIGLAPGSLLGPELASMFAIFTAQAWNLTFAFYHSLRTLPQDLTEAASVYGLNRWQRLVRLELPASVIPLVWNGMLSFGAGWVFLTASEAVSVSGRTVLLPGIGSYIAVAIAHGMAWPVVYAIGATAVVIVAVDQLVWRPLVAWSQRFKVELAAEAAPPRSWALTVLQRSRLLPWLGRTVLAPLDEWLDRRSLRRQGAPPRPLRPWVAPAGWAVLILAVAYAVGPLLWHGLLAIASVPTAQDLSIAAAAGLTLARVLASVLLSALWTVPAGVTIGLSPRLSAIAQPVAQNLTAFPANLLYGLAVLVFLHFGVSLGWGSILLLTLGTQWYLLFNVIAGTQSLPSDLREAARVFGLRGLSQWRLLLLPGIFPSLVTGAITAAGGAWNLTILAEAASWGGHHLTAFGLGYLITVSAADGHRAVLFLAILAMSAIVVGLNRTVWRRLYGLAESRYRLG
jgi:NitT/TauT family transport system permease protein